MKEQNAGSHAPELGENFEKEFSRSLRISIEDIRAQKIPLLETLLTLQRLLLLNSSEECYSDDYIKKLDSHLYLLKEILIHA